MPEKIFIVYIEFVELLFPLLGDREIRGETVVRKLGERIFPRDLYARQIGTPSAIGVVRHSLPYPRKVRVKNCRYFRSFHPSLPPVLLKVLFAFCFLPKSRAAPLETLAAMPQNIRGSQRKRAERKALFRRFFVFSAANGERSF